LNVARRTWPDINHRELLQLLDLMARSREGELAFTPLRMHGFIISTMGGAQDYLAHRTVIDEAEKAGISRMILVTSLGCGDSWP
ncbi:SDR family oxidoreductase, partial [Escherichia coli]|nr:SDR family oxidoreductase [Escherichia coli]